MHIKRLVVEKFPSDGVTSIYHIFLESWIATAIEKPWEHGLTELGDETSPVLSVFSVALRVPPLLTTERADSRPARPPERGQCDSEEPPPRAA